MHIYYAIQPHFSLMPRYTSEGRFDLVYDRIFFITDSHELAEEAENWCRTHGVGDKWEHPLFTIEIIED